MDHSDTYPWIEKYRPDFSELSLQSNVNRTIKRLIEQSELPHLLFYGPSGTGKTSTALAIAHNLFSPGEKNAMTLELNASDDRGINVVRDEIFTFVSTKSLFGNKHKLVILDEADSMTRDAQNALRRIIEDYSSNARFCILCNFVSKIIPPVQSRCMRFRFGRIGPSIVRQRLSKIAILESVELNEEAYEAIVRLAYGDLRKAVNILQSVCMSYSTSENKSLIKESDVYSCTAHPSPSEIRNIVETILNNDITHSVKEVWDWMCEQSVALTDIITEIYDFFKRVTIDGKDRIQLNIKLCEIEFRLALGTNEKIQLGSLIAALQIIRKFE